MRGLPGSQAPGHQKRPVAKTPSDPPSYSAFAEIYDAWQRLYGLEYAILVAPRVNLRLAAHVGRPQTLIDLACGTGTHAVLQAHGGARVIGIDLSAAMLHQARMRAAGRPITFIEADMRTFDTHKPVDAVTCLYASLNHLLDPEDLTHTFKRVAAHLRPGGVFVFDLNSQEAFATLWRTPVTEHGPAFTLHRRFESAGPQTTMHLQIERPGHPTVRDTLTARSFPESDIRAALANANLTCTNLTHFNPFPTVPGTSLKQLWTVTAGS
ncbi:MAG: class I SAM-dependent methyltransferase [Chloroflexota bacterium]|nr:class I SAM-dependent methyltransferase [Chloroflexota bacterium]MDE2898805.1 class I SAM-dependent methyltransferase [Chloroflexota bacterium]